jgi:hypothetical protein
MRDGVIDPTPHLAHVRFSEAAARFVARFFVNPRVSPVPDKRCLEEPLRGPE